MDSYAGRGLAVPRGVLVLTAMIVGTLFLASCSKPYQQNRYDWAAELAKTYSIELTSKEFLSTLGPALAKGGYGFADLALNRSFIGKFEAAAEVLDKQEYFQPENRGLLEGIIADSKLPCEYSSWTQMSDLDCGDRDGATTYKPDALRLLHTDAGDFIFSSADMFRGNGHESNENASAVVIVVDPTDGGFGVILEDHIAIVGGRHNVLAAALSLASSVTRLEGYQTGLRKEPQPEALRFDLEAAKSKTLYKKPVRFGDEAAALNAQAATPEERDPSRNSPNSITKDEFRMLVVGKTMEQIGSLLGGPSNVQDSADELTWFYWPDRLRVTDPDSGTTVTSAAVSFERQNKTAIGVRF